MMVESKRLLCERHSAPPRANSSSTGDRFVPDHNLGSTSIHLSADTATRLDVVAISSGYAQLYTLTETLFHISNALWAEKAYCKTHYRGYRIASSFWARLPGLHRNMPLHHLKDRLRRYVKN
jgi:hypothetical protein